jgi:hypothetical protein
MKSYKTEGEIKTKKKSIQSVRKLHFLFLALCERKDGPRRSKLNTPISPHLFYGHWITFNLENLAKMLQPYKDHLSKEVGNT